MHLIYILKSVQQKYMITFRMAQSITIFIMDASDFWSYFLHDESVQKLSTHTQTLMHLDSQTTIICEILLLNKNPWWNHNTTWQ